MVKSADNAGNFVWGETDSPNEHSTSTELLTVCFVLPLHTADGFGWLGVWWLLHTALRVFDSIES